MRIVVALLLVLGAFGMGSCSHVGSRNPAQEAQYPCSDQPSCEKYVSDLKLVPDQAPFSLYRDESFTGKPGGLWEQERAGFIQDMASVFLAQKKLAEERAAENAKRPQSEQQDTGPGRVFHFKEHGCLVGYLSVLPQKERVNGKFKDKKGITNRSFLRLSPGQQKAYTVVARFSNGVGTSENDNDPDVRGMAIKIFGVTNEDPQQPDDQELRVVDFNMTNSERPFGNVQSDFVAFLNATVQGKLKQAEFLAEPKNLELAGALIHATTKLPHSLTKRQYWAGHAYLLRDSITKDETAMKLNLAPIKEGIELELDRNYLRDDLAKTAAEGSIGFKLQVQLETKKTPPLEDNLKEWTEQESPSLPVANVVFPAQIIYAPGQDSYEKVASQDQRDAALALYNACASAAFTPAHYVVQNRPLSNMGRGRMFSYAASSGGRHSDPNALTADIAARLLDRARVK